MESLHFHVDGVPVDLNIRSLDDIRDTWCAIGFDSILLDGKIIHDPSGRVEHEIGKLRERDRDAETPRGNYSVNIAGMRHGHRHILDKIRKRRDIMPTLSSYLLHQGIYWFVPQYFEVIGIELKGGKHALEFLQKNEPVIFESIERFYLTTDKAEQTELFKSTAEVVLAPVGGLWKDDEVLTFGDQGKGEELFMKLFRKS